MKYKGVEYTVLSTVAAIWNWQFQIGGVVKAGKTETGLLELAARRAQFKINSELRKLALSGTRESEQYCPLNPVTGGPIRSETIKLPV